jgi:hypothetical protein
VPRIPHEWLRKVSTLNEKSLHTALKDWHGQPDDQLEVSVDDVLVDVVRGNLLTEIQTRNLAGEAQIGH